MNKIMLDMKTDIEAFQVRKEKFNNSIKEVNFNNRPPIFKALMKLEFEKAIREYLKKE